MTCSSHTLRRFHLAILLIGAIFSVRTVAADANEWRKLRDQTIAYQSAHRTTAETDPRAEASAPALLKVAEQLGPLPRNLHLMEASLQLLASVYDTPNQYGEALAIRIRLLGMQEQYYGKENPLICVTLTRLASTYAKLQRPDDAESAYKRILAIKEASTPKRLTGILMDLGHHYKTVKNYPEAEVSFKRLTEVYESEGGVNNPNLKPVLGYLSDISRRLGRKKEASAYAARAAAIRD